MGILGNVTKDSHFTLLKVYSSVRSIEEVVKDNPSAYTEASKELSLAQSLMLSDLHKTLSHLKKAEKLYIKESALARRYNKLSDRIQSANDDEIIHLNMEYLSAVRSGKFKIAEKTLSRIETKGIPVAEEHLAVAISKDRKYAVITNRTNSTVFVDAFSVMSVNQTVRSEAFKGTMHSGESKQVPLSSEMDGESTANLGYSLKGKYHSRKYKLR